MRSSSGPNEHETAGRRSLRKKDRCREQPLCEARAIPNKRETAGRRPLRKKDRSREQPLCEARAGPTSARLQGGGCCEKSTAPVSSPYARPERAQLARDYREEAAAEKGSLP